MERAIAILLASTLGFHVWAEDVTVADAKAEDHRYEVRDFVMDYAKQQSVDVVIDPRIKGSVTLLSLTTPDVITEDEFHAVLNTHGWAATQEDDLIMVHQLVLAKQHNLPFYDPENPGEISPKRIVTAVIPLKRRDAGQLMVLMRPLVEQWGYIGVDAPSNSLTLVTTAGNVDRLTVLASKLDTKPVNVPREKTGAREKSE